jgi:hypothetical protein
MYWYAIWPFLTRSSARIDVCGQMLLASPPHATITPTDRFAFFAKRVRVLYLTHDTTRDNPRLQKNVIHAEVYLLWAAIGHLFPRLRGLTVHTSFFTLPQSPTVLNMFLFLKSHVLTFTSLSINVDLIDSHLLSALLDRHDIGADHQLARYHHKPAPQVWISRT